MVSWLPVGYTADSGHYNVYISQTEGGPYSLAGSTADKSTVSLNVSGLTPAQRYFFVVRTVTSAHANNANPVESKASAEVSTVAWTETNVQITGTVTLGGSPLVGVVMNGLNGSPSTNASGAYTGTVAGGWIGTVTPVLAGYAFNPTSRIYTSVSTDQMAQDFAATAIAVPTLIVTSPNGGETWAAGSTHAVTWTSADMTGTVTIDLYKGGGFHRTLGTAEAMSGTFSWHLGMGETIGTDYAVMVWEGGTSSDDSDANFMLVRVDRTDIDRDGQEDILWRYIGGGEIQGWNVTWLLSQSQALPLKIQRTALTDPGAMIMNSDLNRTRPYLSPLDFGISSKSSPDLSFMTPLGSYSPRAYKPKMAMRDAGAYNRDLTARDLTVVRENHLEKVETNLSNTLNPDPIKHAPSDLGIVGAGDVELAALKMSEIASLPPVLDTDWEIAATGDFNSDGNTDILWRYYGGEGIQGWNVIWYMNGTSIMSYGFIPTVQDTNWRVAGMGDFDGDGNLDVLWRYYGSGELQGWNVIWHMDGETIASYRFPNAVVDTEWRIEGVGDFNCDGKSDILWRNYGSGDFMGWNIIWYMDGEMLIDYGYPTPVLKLGWKADVVGDFDGDGKADILWRNYDTGEHEGLNVIRYMDGGAGIKNREFLTQVYDTRWKIVNR